MSYVLNIRRYKKNCELLNVQEFVYSDCQKSFGMALARNLVNVENLLGGSPNCLKLNPCNVSVRGPNGKFVSWKK